MDEFLFISQSYLNENSVIDNNVDYKNLRSSIITAQDLYLEDLLGTPFYEDLVAKGIAGTLSADETALIKKYIQKTMLWWVLQESPPDFKYKYANKGIQVKNSDNSQSADSGDIVYLMNRCKKKAEIYAEKTTRYLRLNVSKFPKYYEYTITGMNHKLNNYTTGIYLDDYEQEEWRNYNGGII